MIYQYQSLKSAFFQPFLTQGKTVMVFSASWCGTCRAIQRTMREYSEKHCATILYVDVDQEKAFSEQYHVKGIPVIILMENGIVIGKTAGSLNYEEFCDWIDLIQKNRPQ